MRRNAPYVVVSLNLHARDEQQPQLHCHLHPNLRLLMLQESPCILYIHVPTCVEVDPHVLEIKLARGALICTSSARSLNIPWEP